MHLQTAVGETICKTCPEGPGLPFAHTMHHPIVGVSTPRIGRVHAAHPRIKRIVQEEVCQHRADDPTLWSAMALDHSSSGRFEALLWSPTPKDLPSSFTELTHQFLVCYILMLLECGAPTAHIGQEELSWERSVECIDLPSTGARPRILGRLPSEPYTSNQWEGYGKLPQETFPPTMFQASHGIVACQEEEEHASPRAI